jgi:hypothetical protein
MRYEWRHEEQDARMTHEGHGHGRHALNGRIAANPPPTPDRPTITMCSANAVLHVGFA